MIKSFLTALTFLTIVPLKIKNGESSDTKHFGLAMAMFPLVGLIIGLTIFVANYLSLKYFSNEISAALILFLLFIITAGLHADGFMDTVDGVVGSKGDWNKEKIFKIMSDPNTGAAASAAFTLLMILKWALLVEISSSGHLTALILIVVLSRWSLIFITYLFPYAKEVGMGKAFKDSLNLVHIFISLVMTLIITAVISFYFLSLTALLMLPIVTVVSFAIAQYFKSKLGGITGDILGFICEVSEIIFLISYISIAV